MDRLTIAARGISVSVDLAVGHLADLAIEAGGRTLQPLHRAPWIDGADGTRVPDDIPEGQKRLSGDFLCAPFGTSDIEPAPLHGWPANSPWRVSASGPIEGGWQATLELGRSVLGARIEKVLTLRDGHPFLYQEHVITGGAGALPVAHHAMTAMNGGGRLAFSPKRHAETPPTALESDPSRGRSRLAYPARAALDAFPTADGSTTDLRDYPGDSRSEDFVTLIEAEHGGPGWTAIARQAEGDIVLVLKDPEVLPVTMLWLSDGGRDYAPWSGRHRGVIGIEDGRTAMGHSASLGNNPLKALGIPTAFDLGGRISVRHVIGCLPAPRPGIPPEAITASASELRLLFADGETALLRHDGGYLGRLG